MFVVNLLFSQLYFTRKNALKARLFAIILFTRLIQGECIHPLTLNWVMSSIVLAAFPQNEPKCAKTQDVFGTRSTRLHVAGVHTIVLNLCNNSTYWTMYTSRY